MDELERIRQEPDEFSDPKDWLETRDLELGRLLAWYCDAVVAGGIPKDAYERTKREHQILLRRLGRNDPCWCGSGKKFKKCHGRES
jgi:uncharacterized protein YecA (UPF0149 family)